MAIIKTPQVTNVGKDLRNSTHTVGTRCKLKHAHCENTMSYLQKYETKELQYDPAILGIYLGILLGISEGNKKYN